MDNKVQECQIGIEELRRRSAAGKKQFCRDMMVRMGKVLCNPNWREFYYDNWQFSLNVARAFPAADDKEGRHILHSTIFPLITESDLRHIIDCAKNSRHLKNNRSERTLKEMMDDYLEWKSSAK